MWTKVALAPEFLKPPAPYLPMILPSFDEEAYMNKPNEHVPKPIPAQVVAPTDEVANLVEEVREMIAEVSRERFAEETGREDGEDVSRDPPPEL